MIVNGVLFFCKQKTAYEMRISDRRSDVCSSDLLLLRARRLAGAIQRCDAGAETRTFRYRAAELLWHRQSLLDRQSESRRRYRPGHRSEEHTSELQSLMRISYAVFCLKKKKTNTQKTKIPLSTTAQPIDTSTRYRR